MSTPPFEGTSSGPDPGTLPEGDPNIEIPIAANPSRTVTIDRAGDDEPPPAPEDELLNFDINNFEINRFDFQIPRIEPNDEEFDILLRQVLGERFYVRRRPSTSDEEEEEEEDADENDEESDEEDEEEDENRIAQRGVLQRVLNRSVPQHDALGYLLDNEILPGSRAEHLSDQEDGRDERRREEEEDTSEFRMVSKEMVDEMLNSGEELTETQRRIIDEYMIHWNSVQRRRNIAARVSDSENDDEEEEDDEARRRHEESFNQRIEETGGDDVEVYDQVASTSQSNDGEVEDGTDEDEDEEDQVKRRIANSPDRLLDGHLGRQQRVRYVTTATRKSARALKTLGKAMEDIDKVKIPWEKLIELQRRRPVEGDSSDWSRESSPELKREPVLTNGHSSKHKKRVNGSLNRYSNSEDDTPMTSAQSNRLMMNGKRTEKKEETEIEKARKRAMRRSRKNFEYQRELQKATDEIVGVAEDFQNQMVSRLSNTVRKVEGVHEHWKTDGDLTLEEVSTAQRFGRIRHTLPTDSKKKEWVPIGKFIGEKEKEVDERDQLPFVDYGEDDSISDIEQEEITEGQPAPFVKQIMRNMGYRYVRKKLKEDHPPEPRKEDYADWQFRGFYDDFEKRKKEDAFFYSQRYRSDEALEDELIATAMNQQQPGTSNGVTTRYRSGTPLSRVGGSPANHFGPSTSYATREHYSSPQPLAVGSSRNRTAIATPLTNGGTPGRSTPQVANVSTRSGRRLDKDQDLEEEKVLNDDELEDGGDEMESNHTGVRMQRKQRKVYGNGNGSTTTTSSSSTTTLQVPEKKTKREKMGKEKKGGEDEMTTPSQVVSTGGGGGGQAEQTVTTTKKRGGNRGGGKRAKDPDEPTYCVCSKISYGEMIGCDNDKCEIEWFHFECVKLSTKPKGKWYCPNCRHPDIGAKQMKQFGQVSTNRTTRQTEKA